MIGRGALSHPDLARKIKAQINKESYSELTWENILHHIIHSSMHQTASNDTKYFASRTKQWLGYLKRQSTKLLVQFNNSWTTKVAHIWVSL